MEIAATIRGGVAVSDDIADLPDGTPVTLVLEPAVDDFELTPEEEALLEERCAQADRGGAFFTAEEVLRRLDAQRLPPR